MKHKLPIELFHSIRIHVHVRMSIKPFSFSLGVFKIKKHCLETNVTSAVHPDNFDDKLVKYIGMSLNEASNSIPHEARGRISDGERWRSTCIMCREEYQLKKEERRHGIKPCNIQRGLMKHRCIYVVEVEYLA